MRELLTLKLTDIDLEDRARQDHQLDDDFLNSIREKGVLQPISVARKGDGRYKLLAGGRRFTASKQLEIPTIPCHVVADTENLNDKEIEFIENALRRDLKWQERLKLVVDIRKLMVEKYGEKGSLTKTADFIDRSVGGIHRIVSLADTVKRFPALLACATEDEAVRKARKILEGALVQKLSKQAVAEAGALGITSEEQTVDQVVAQSAPPGEGFKEDPYIRLCRSAQHHYRIGDCFEEMRGMLEDGLNPPIQLVEVDPPYGIDLQTQKKGEPTRELDIYEEIPRENYAQWTSDLINTIDAVIPANCRILYWFAQEWYQTIVDCFDEVGWDYDPIPCIWSKGSGQTNAPDLYLARTYETFLVATKGDGIPLVERGRSNVFNFPPVPASKKYHPTQKPLALMDEILATFSWPRGILLCPFLGSGVTLRAAYRRGLLPIGWELNEENKKPFLAALEEDIENHKVGEQPGENKNSDIPF